MPHKKKKKKIIHYNKTSRGESNRLSAVAVSLRMMQHASSSEPDVVTTLPILGPMVNPTLINTAHYERSTRLWQERTGSSAKCRLRVAEISSLRVNTAAAQTLRPGLRSANSTNYSSPRLSTRFGIGERAFSHAGPAAWNSLPHELRAAPTLNIFKSRLKSHFFKIAFNL